MIGKDKPEAPNSPLSDDGLPTDAELDALQAAIDSEKANMAKRGDLAAKTLMGEDSLVDNAMDYNASLNPANPSSPEPNNDQNNDPSPADNPRALAEQKIVQLERELASLKDQALRAMADAENVKKRAEREVTAARNFGIERFALDILSVYDNLSRALTTLDGTDKADLGDNAKNLVDGIELTEKDLILTLSRHGVKVVPGVGARFDPNIHQAVAQIASSEEKGHIATVMQTGFTLADRTLRAAMVAVSTGPA